MTRDARSPSALLLRARRCCSSCSDCRRRPPQPPPALLLLLRSRRRLLLVPPASPVPAGPRPRRVTPQPSLHWRFLPRRRPCARRPRIMHWVRFPPQGPNELDRAGVGRIEALHQVRCARGGYGGQGAERLQELWGGVVGLGGVRDILQSLTESGEH